MAAVTICSDFGGPQNKICHSFHFFPIYFLWSDGTRCHDLSFLNVGFQAFSLFSFILIKRLLSSSSLSAMRVVPSASLRLLIFLLAILIPACASSSLEFHMMYSAYKLNMAGYDTNKSREHNRRMRKRDRELCWNHYHSMSTVCMHKTVLTEVWHHQRSYTVRGIDLTNKAHWSQETTIPKEMGISVQSQMPPLQLLLWDLWLTCHWSLSANASPSITITHLNMIVSII